MARVGGSEDIDREGGPRAMDREQFLEQAWTAPAGGKENIGLCDFRSGCLSVTVKDRSVIDLTRSAGCPVWLTQSFCAAGSGSPWIKPSWRNCKWQKKKITAHWQNRSSAWWAVRECEQRHPLCHPSAIGRQREKSIRKEEIEEIEVSRAYLSHRDSCRSFSAPALSIGFMRNS